jgi:hypothetical protein
VEPGASADTIPPDTPDGDEAAAVYREKSTLSTVDPAEIEIAFADAILAVSG